MNKNIESMAPQIASLGCHANYIRTPIGMIFNCLATIS
jgi:hypothetical protein